MDEVLDHLVCLDHPDDPGGHAQDRKDLFWRGFGEDAFKTGRLTGKDRGCLPIETTDGPVEERDIFLKGSPVQQVADGIVVHGIDNPISPANEIADIVRADGGIYRVDGDIRIVLMQFLDGGYRLLLPDIPVRVEDLAVQVALVDRVHINDGNRSHAGYGKVDGYGGAKATGTGNKYVGFFQLFLPFLAKQEDLPFIPFAFAF